VDWSTTGPPNCPTSPAEGCAEEPAGTGGGRRAVAIGADHGAFPLKQQLKRYLEEELKYPVVDCGTHSEESVDYPDIARDVALAVAEGRAWRGIVLDAMGIGSGMAANRIAGVLCAVCHDVASVRNAREHNDANLLSLGSRVVNPGEARRLVRTFLATEHGGGRHGRRVAKIRALEDLHRPIQRGT
jgi:ribose 5-phosphate isomerase B